MITPKPGSYYDWRTQHAPLTMSFTAIEGVACPYFKCRALPDDQILSVGDDNFCADCRQDREERDSREDRMRRFIQKIANANGSDRIGFLVAEAREILGQA